MVERKARAPIPRIVAARVLFEADRTCCVCRGFGKTVQIHHVNDNPSDNDPNNLAVLCLECHGDTQLQGGFGRKLDAEQVRLYRDDWRSSVTSRRLQGISRAADGQPTERSRVEYFTSLIERLREATEYSMVAHTYHMLGNVELRDKYIELAIQQQPDDAYTVISMRGLQRRPDAVPAQLVEERLQLQADRQDWSQRARTLRSLGRRAEATQDYIRSVHDALEGGNTFSAAFYLKELYESTCLEALFERAYEEAEAEGDLWWQIRALQELGWTTELNALLLRNADKIEGGSVPSALHLLRSAQGDEEAADKASLDFFGGIRSLPGTEGVVVVPSEDDGSAPINGSADDE